MRRFFPAALLLAIAAPAGAQTPAPIAFESYRLPNGLTVILAEDHSSQVVAVDLWYDVGSRNERPGRSGFAHLFEHMMYQGSAHVQKGQHAQMIERAGGSMNGQTEDDLTRYYEVLPSNQLNLGLWLEADRMRSLAVNDSNFHNQRETVKEERRLRFDNQPYAGTFVDGLYGLYDSTTCFPYSHSVIGSMADLDAATTADVQEFFHTYYAPGNARLVVAGDFKPVEAKRLIADYFSGIQGASAPQPVECNTKFGGGAMRRTATDKLANLPAAVHFYRIPAHDHADTPALELLGIILGQGESSRLKLTLVREARAAVASQAGIFGNRRGPGAFGALAIANQGITADSIDALLTTQIGYLGDSLSEAEVTKAKNIYRASVISSRQSAFDIAEALQHAALFLGNPEAANTDFRRYMAVTVDDVRRVARTYLRPENSLTLIVNVEAQR